MKSFLEYVAEDIISKYGSNTNDAIDLTDIVVVFPNKRASLFLNQYLYHSAGNKPVWCPQYVTISDLFRQQTELTTADPILSVCILYDVYSRVMGDEHEVESLDHFWSWGQMMLADFDDLDKNMGDARLIFNNVRDLEALRSAPDEYLTEIQRKALEQFFHLVTDNDADSALKHNFERLWNNLYRIYEEFNNELTSKGLAYEGHLYRDVAERAENLKWDDKTYLFVGFNMTQKTEQTVFRSMKRQGIAKFYWDYDVYYADKEAGHFINKELMLLFPNELPADSAAFQNFQRKDERGEKVMKKVTYLSASTENIQARYIADWLTEKGAHRLEPGQRTAIVLSDESLLKNIIHSLPQASAATANITVGFPLSQSPVTSLVKNFLMLHRDDFDLRKVSNILRHPYAEFLSTKSAALLEYLHTNKIFFPTLDDLRGHDDKLDLLFNPFKGEPASNARLMSAMQRILQVIGRECELRRVQRLVGEGIDPTTGEATYEEQFMQESIFRMHAVITRIHELATGDEYLAVDINTLTRIIDQIIQTTTMPFHGEPAVNLQIMGVLETRNLDFDHVLILSCNEGNLPKDVSSSSLIPYIVRKAHGLTTVDHKVAIFAYYFYRLLQRCDDICISYNSSTEDGNTGQMSRFMLQLMAENEYMSLSQQNLITRQSPATPHSRAIAKDDDVMNALGNVSSLSPSIINKYLRCPLQFYYDKLAGLREADDEDSIDPRNFGTIFHAAAEQMYNNINRNRIITPDAIKALLDKKGEADIYRFVDEAFKEKFFNGRQPRYDGMQTINREVIKRFLVQLLRADLALAPFEIIGLEQDAYEHLEISMKDGSRKNILIGGNIDRLDCINKDSCDGNVSQLLRVVDYKTGRSVPDEQSSVEDLFDPKNIDKHSDYLLQVMLYSMIVRHSQEPQPARGDRPSSAALNPHNYPVSPALLYIQRSESVKNPVIKMGKGKDAMRMDDIIDYETTFRTNLNQLLAEIFDPHTPFTPTPYTKRCERCAYRDLCKR